MHIHNLAHPMSVTHQIALSHHTTLVLLSSIPCMSPICLSLSLPKPIRAIALPGLIKPS
ncbi:hypothetical protein CGRA01v4_03838 [Colletotrichum graminicola]|nr:hypothetical protein CGRA01v4_03838 [Colletotrichum graminicola]